MSSPISYRDGELAIFKNAHHSTLAYKIYLKMSSNDSACFLLGKQSQWGGGLSQKNLDKIFIPGLYEAAAFLPKIIQMFSRSDTFTNPSPIWQSSRALITRKNLKKTIKNFIDFVLILYSELGFLGKGFRDFPFNKYLGTFLGTSFCCLNPMVLFLFFEQAIL